MAKYIQVVENGKRKFETYTPAGTLTSEQLAVIASQVPPDSSKVDKVTGKSLVFDTEISKIHASGSDNQDLSALESHATSQHLNFSGLAKISVGFIEPVNPSVGDIWIDTSF